MKNIKLTIEYDGSRYRGWTRLGKDSSMATVSNKINEVIKKMTGESVIDLNCGCRTETGVHAYAQVVNFKTVCEMSLTDMKHYLNRYLPMDIAITDIEQVPERFHAALNAKSKTYVYRMTITDTPSVFERKLTYHCFKKPNQTAMLKAARLMKGRHDFKNFSSTKKSKSTIRQIYSIDIYSDDEEMLISIRADDFLYNMNRILIGTLLDVGFGVRPLSSIIDIFEGKEDASQPCDPKGLYLQEIHY